MSDVPYTLGHSESEIRRLMFQAAVVAPITSRLLREAGLARGMRVLDLGCGAGDVATLAAEMVGPAGAVVGIDRNAEVLALARSRARAADHKNIEFREGSAEDFNDSTSFDLAIGRHVPTHQADPAAFIRAAASHVSPGGVLAFHEHAIYGGLHSIPLVPLWKQGGDWIIAFHSVRAHSDAGGRMVEHFHHAGLKPPTMFCEIPVGSGPDSPIYAWLALTLRSALPHLEKIGAATAAEVDIDTLEDRLRKAVVAAHSQALGPAQFCGSVRI